MIYTVKGFDIVNRVEVDVFLELFCFFYDHLTCLLRNLCAGQEATLRIRYEQWTGSKLGKESVKAIYCHLAYLTSMQSTQ